MERITTYIERIRPWPWRQIIMVIVGSFLFSALVSTILGWWLMGHAGVNMTVNATVKMSTKASLPGQLADHTVDQFSLSPNSGLAKLSVDKILERNIFNSEGSTGDVDSSAPGHDMAKTTLPIRVLGIIYGGTPFDGIAMIENSQTKVVNSFMVNDQITPDAKVLEIQQEQVLIDNKGRTEVALLDEVVLRRSSRRIGGKAKIAAPTFLSGSGYAVDAPPETFKEDGFERKGTNIEVSSEYKSRLLTTDFANVLQDAKASPNMVDGVLKGWRMDRIRKDSFYEKAGMQNGDVVEEINGVVLSDAGQSIKLMNQLRNESEIDIKINRNGAHLILNMKVR